MGSRIGPDGKQTQYDNQQRDYDFVLWVNAALVTDTQPPFTVSFVCCSFRQACVTSKKQLSGVEYVW